MAAELFSKNRTKNKMCRSCSTKQNENDQHLLIGMQIEFLTGGKNRESMRGEGSLSRSPSSACARHWAGQSCDLLFSFEILLKKPARGQRSMIWPGGPINKHDGWQVTQLFHLLKYPWKFFTAVQKLQRRNVKGEAPHLCYYCAG